MKEVFDSMLRQLGFLTIKENNIKASTQGVFILSSTSPGHWGDSRGNGIFLNDVNFRKSIALYYVRLGIKSNWICGSDVYASPIE